MHVCVRVCAHVCEVGLTLLRFLRMSKRSPLSLACPSVPLGRLQLHGASTSHLDLAGHMASECLRITGGVWASPMMRTAGLTGVLCGPAMDLRGQRPGQGSRSRTSSLHLLALGSWCLGPSLPRSGLQVRTEELVGHAASSLISKCRSSQEGTHS